MKASMLSLLFALFALFTLSAFGEPPNQSGRYQLVAGSYGTGPDQRATIVKIDTATGETWELVLVPYPAKGADGSRGQVTVSGWAPIAADVALEIKRLRELGALSNIPAKSR